MKHIATAMLILLVGGFVGWFVKPTETFDEQPSRPCQCDVIIIDPVHGDELLNLNGVLCRCVVVSDTVFASDWIDISIQP